jgi:hypothetical protein
MDSCSIEKSNQHREIHMSDLRNKAGEYKTSTTGCRPKEGQVDQKTQAALGVVVIDALVDPR